MIKQNMQKYMKNFIITCIMLLGLSLNVLAQETVVVSGVVTEKTGEPIIGVNITVSDKPGLGTITDINGRYKIKVEQYSKLVYSFVGYEKVVILVKDNHTINVKMSESTSSILGEVVVTAVGTQKKLTVTGAISTVNVDDLNRNPSSSLSNSLAGNVAGVMAMQTSGQPGKNFLRILDSRYFYFWSQQRCLCTRRWF